MAVIETEIKAYLKRLFPICRSITGNGNRETLRILRELIPLKIIEYPSGISVYDWVIPEEWNIREAWVKNGKGRKIIDFQKSNLHIMSYSKPMKSKMSFNQLLPHLHYLEDLPEAIPYRTTYYQKNWGFCLSFKDFRKFFRKNEEYEIYIDSDFKQGSLTIGEMLIPGKSQKEFLISTYICHPSMANDNLSGMLLTAFLARELRKKKRNFSYRIIFVPETIGAIAYCAHNAKAMKRIKSGFVVTCVGGRGNYTYRQTHDSSHFLNHFAERVLARNKIQFQTKPFDMHGSDERQFSSQGFGINVCSICRDKYYDYPFYHTSMDNLDFVRSDSISGLLKIYLEIIEEFERDLVFKNLFPHGEIMLSQHGLYPKTGGSLNPEKQNVSSLDAILWLLFLSDGKTRLHEISQRTKLPMDLLYQQAKILEKKNLLKEIPSRE